MTTAQIFSMGMGILQLLAFIGVIVFIASRFRRKKRGGAKHETRDWYLNISLSKEDGLSQSFLLLFILFFGIALLAINRNMASPVSVQTIVLITSLIGLGSTYLLRALYILPFSIIGILIWWLVQAQEWIEAADIREAVLLAVVGLVALLYYLIGQLHERKKKYKRLALVFSVVGLVMMTAILFVLSTKPGLNMLESLTEGSAFFGSWQISVSLLLVLIGIGGSAISALSSKNISIYEVLAISVFVVMFVFIAFLPQQDFFISDSTSLSFSSANNGLTAAGILWTTIFNVLVFLLLVGIIFVGYMQREVWLINYGALFLFILIIVKYFDWFFTFLDKSIFFITAGILMLILGWGMEKGRRRLISTASEKV
jgi:uncharacterized membrane protein